MKKILLVGCGNIGFRHLQALGQLAEPALITVVEPNRDLHPRIETEAEQIRQAGRGHELRLLDDLAQWDGTADLAVIATSAGPRRALLSRVLAAGKVPAIILEKILAQSHADLAAMGDDLAAADAVGVVNCPRRYFPGYHDLKARLTTDQPVNVTVEGAEFGLASNAVHFLDLIEYLNDSQIVAVDGAGLDDGSVEAKRAGCVELYGKLTATLANGARLHITCARDEPVRLALTISNQARTAHINELAREITMDDSAPGVFETRFVSQTPEIYADLLETGKSGLPGYAASAGQHRHYLSAVRKHLGLDETADETCPVS